MTESSLPIKRILLIDDDEATNFMHQRLVSRVLPDIQIQVANNGVEGLGLLGYKEGNATFSEGTLIFLDINMPVMNGWEFLETFKKLPDSSRKGLSIFMVSTSTHIRDMELKEAYEDLVLDYLVKPLTIPMVSKALEENLNIKVEI